MSVVRCISFCFGGYIFFFFFVFDLFLSSASLVSEAFTSIMLFSLVSEENHVVIIFGLLSVQSVFSV